jgi:hypothetical protein
MNFFKKKKVFSLKKSKTKDTHRGIKERIFAMGCLFKKI